MNGAAVAAAVLGVLLVALLALLAVFTLRQRRRHLTNIARIRAEIGQMQARMKGADGVDSWHGQGEPKGTY